MKLYETSFGRPSRVFDFKGWELKKEKEEIDEGSKTKYQTFEKDGNTITAEIIVYNNNDTTINILDENTPTGSTKAMTDDELEDLGILEWEY